MQCHRLIRIQIANGIYQVMAVGTAVNLMPGVVTLNVGPYYTYLIMFQYKYWIRAVPLIF